MATLMLRSSLSSGRRTPASTPGRYNSRYSMFSRGYSVPAHDKILTLDTINERVRKAEYAVRGELVMRAEQHQKTLHNQKKHDPTHTPRLPFDEIVLCNIGNPQSLGQKPITFYRQFLSLMEYPDLMKSPHASELFPNDVIQRAKRTLESIGAGMGAYSHSQGIPLVRKDIAQFIERRDGYPSDHENIFLYNGASPAVQNVLRLLIRDKHDGILTPVPQYPLYSASITLSGGSQVPYYLDEDKDWGLTVSEIDRALKEGEKQGINTRALVIINPGNPTGQVMSIDNMREIIEYCQKKRLVLMADEVYQENVYIKDERPWASFKKVLRSMGSKYENFELFSFHSISKGVMGECGQRGGYLEAVSIDPDVKSQLYKLASVLLCPNTAGQLLVDVMVNPPKPGDESYSLYEKERTAIYDSLKRRANKLTGFLNTLEGVTCNRAQGAMYAFPQIRLPAKAVQHALSNGRRPDEIYCISLLDATGVCVVPGSGFGQKDGTYHFRTTFLPSEDQIDKVLEKVATFHKDFYQRFK